MENSSDAIGNRTSEYVILILFPRQQWLRERALVLRYTWFSCLFSLFNSLTWLWSRRMFLLCADHAVSLKYALDPTTQPNRIIPSRIIPLAFSENNVILSPSCISNMQDSTLTMWYRNTAVFSVRQYSVCRCQSWHRRRHVVFCLSKTAVVGSNPIQGSHLSQNS
jgi:hypothetical protein